MKMLITVVALALSLNVLANQTVPLPGGTQCLVHLSLAEDGMIFGKTNSSDLFPDSAYRDFKVEDDDGFITQTLIFNKLLAQKGPLPKLTVEDGIVLSRAVDRAIAYSSDEKLLSNPKLKAADKENLAKVVSFNKLFKEALKRSKSSNHVIDPQIFGQWKVFMESQRHEHYFTLHGLSNEPTRGIVNLCGAYPASSPDCCKLKIAELNNVLAMSLCGKSFTTGEEVNKVYPSARTKCHSGYDVIYETKGGSVTERSKPQGSKQ